MGIELDWHKDGLTWPHSTASRFVEAGGLRWHVQVLGQGPVLLLVHGTGASTHSWRWLISLLAPHYTIVAPDMPGHGFTGQPARDTLTLPGMARGLSALLRELNIAPDIAVGHSAGAAIVLRAALDGGIAPRLIISLNGALLPFRGFAGQFFKPLAKFLVMQPFLPQVFAWRAGSSRAVDGVLRGTGSQPSSDDVALYARLFQSSRHVASTLAMMANWELQPLVRDLPKLQIPVVLVAASADRAIPPSDAARSAAQIANSSIEALPGLGHLAHEENPEVIAELIERYAATANIK
jgi:magnesium chelatase accessory protein